MTAVVIRSPSITVKSINSPTVLNAQINKPELLTKTIVKNTSNQVKAVAQENRRYSVKLNNAGGTTQVIEQIYSGDVDGGEF